MVDLVVGDEQRWRQAQRGGRDGVDDGAELEEPGGHVLGVVAVELDGEEQPEAAHVGDARAGPRRRP